MKVGMALKQLAKAEIELADEYEKVGQREAAEQDVYHTCLSLQRQCLEHAQRIGVFAERYGSDAPDPDDPPEVWDSLVAHMRHAMSNMAARRPASGLLLLRDLRQLYHMAHEVSFHWVAVGQAAQALRDRELLDAATEMHEQTLTQIKWIKTRLKESAPQVLVAG